MKEYQESIQVCHLVLELQVSNDEDALRAHVSHVCSVAVSFSGPGRHGTLPLSFAAKRTSFESI